MKKIILSTFITAVLNSCSSYEHVTDHSSSQSVPSISGIKQVSGKPNLHLPARMGILTTSRFSDDTLSNDEINQLKAPGISEIMPVNQYMNDNHCYKMADLMYRRSEIIENTKFLGLDVILLCDEVSSTQEQEHIPSMKYLTLGVINPKSKKTNAQLDAVLMDARTGYIYGAAGDSDSRSAHSLTFVESEIMANASANKANQNAKKQLLTKFPNFWNNVKGRYGR